MRSRTLREGSVGLLILVGLALFGGITIWLRGIEFGRTSYNLVVEFANANGMAIGAPVRYRGVNVGKIVAIEPGTNGIDVTVQISPVDLLIPRDVVIKANQSGLISQTSIDITPRSPLSKEAQAFNPTSSKCDPQLIICDGNRLQGEAGATIDDLLSSATRLSEVYASPEFSRNINKLLGTADVTAKDVAKLSTELKLLSRSVRQQLPILTGSAANASNSLNTTSTDISQAANRIVGTVEEFRATGRNFNELAVNLNGLIAENRSDLIGALNSMKATSDGLQELVVALKPAAYGLNAALDGEEIEQLLNNVNALIANSAIASENLRDLSTSFSDPTLLLSLQQTLSSARETFENMRKITSEVDELTGDPAFRQNLRNLVNGLSDLLSSTQELEQRIQLARELEQSQQAAREIEEYIQIAQKLEQASQERDRSANPTNPRPIPPSSPTPATAAGKSKKTGFSHFPAKGSNSEKEGNWQLDPQKTGTIPEFGTEY